MAENVPDWARAATPSWAVKASEKPAEPPTKSVSAFESVWEGITDPVRGGGQLVGNVLPYSASAATLGAISPQEIRTALDEANNYLARSTGIVKELPSGGVNEQVRKREQAYQKSRGPDPGIDWGRIAGDIMSPVNYLGGLVGEAAVPGGALLSAIWRAGISGATAGGTQPVTGENFATTKAEQVGGGAVAGGVLSSLFSGGSAAYNKLGEYLWKKNPASAEDKAVQTVLRRIKQDEKAGHASATDMIDLINKSNKPMAVADVGGPNVRGLAGNVVRSQGESKAIATSFLNKRDEQAAQRLSQDINRYVFGGPTMHQATEATLQMRSAASRPAYDAMHELQNVWSPRLQQFFQDPAIKVGLNRGYELERLESLAENRPLSLHQMGVDLDLEGNIKLVKAPNMRLLDMAKRGLDAMIADERNELTGRLSARGVALDKMRRAYVETIDDLDTSGLYKKARETWQGYSASLDSMRIGRAVFQNSPEENAAEIAKLSPANKEFYRLGVADVLRERLAKAGFSSDEAKQLMKNQWMKDQLRPAFRSDADFDKFTEAVAEESKMFATKQKMLGGSETAERVAEDNSAENVLRGVSIAGKVLSGRMFTAAKDSFQFYRDIGIKPDPAVNEKISEILFTTPMPKGPWGNPLVRKLLGPPPVKPPPAPVVDVSKTVAPVAGVAAGKGSDLE